MWIYGMTVLVEFKSFEGLRKVMIDNFQLLLHYVVVFMVLDWVKKILLNDYIGVRHSQLHSRVFESVKQIPYFNSLLSMTLGYLTIILNRNDDIFRGIHLASFFCLELEANICLPEGQILYISFNMFLQPPSEEVSL